MAYIEDLMREQVRRGHDVSYFFSGRQYPFTPGPRLMRWKRDGVPMLEVVNSPLYDHGRQPELELEEPRVERLFEEVLHEARPDVVHFQELAGLPSSLLEVARRSGTPAVVTLQDYFPLCSTFKLLDADGQVCLRREVGEDCVATNAADPRHPGLLIEWTLRFHLSRLPLGPSTSRRQVRIRNVVRRVAAADVRRRLRAAQEAPATPAAFQRRRDVNTERLNRADCLIAMSHRVGEIYSQLGVDQGRIRTIHLTLAHIERLRPREAVLGGGPLTFATLGGFESVAKGGRLLISAMGELAESAPAGAVRLLVLGRVDPRLAEEAKGVAGVEIRGTYRPEELDAILEAVDVGIMPSIWEEAYGYAGVEFLAKGIPVIANAIGGMTDYTREGETGWLNRSCSSAGLARIMTSVIEQPQEVVSLNARLRASREVIIKPLSRHAAEMDDLYREMARAGMR